MPERNDDLVLDRLIHEPGRLAILTVLSSVRSADFVFLQRTTGLTKGNLSSHLTKLEDAGLIAIEKSFVRKRPNTSVALTSRGAERVARHWEQLERLRDLARAPAAGTTRAPESRGLSEERVMGLEPTTFCMASRRSSQLSYTREAGGVYRPAAGGSIAEGAAAALRRPARDPCRRRRTAPPRPPGPASSRAAFVHRLSTVRSTRACGRQTSGRPSARSASWYLRSLVTSASAPAARASSIIEPPEPVQQATRSRRVQGSPA